MYGGGSALRAKRSLYYATNVFKQSTKLAIESVGLGERVFKRYTPLDGAERRLALDMLGLAVADL